MEMMVTHAYEIKMIMYMHYFIKSGGDPNLLIKNKQQYSRTYFIDELLHDALEAYIRTPNLKEIWQDVMKLRKKISSSANENFRYCSQKGSQQRLEYDLREKLENADLNVLNILDDVFLQNLMFLYSFKTEKNYACIKTAPKKLDAKILQEILKFVGLQRRNKIDNETYQYKFTDSIQKLKYGIQWQLEVSFLEKKNKNLHASKITFASE